MWSGTEAVGRGMDGRGVKEEERAKPHKTESGPDQGNRVGVGGRTLSERGDRSEGRTQRTQIKGNCSQIIGDLVRRQ